MHSARYARWKIEAIAAALFAIAAAVTAAVPQWMEALGFDPDHGSGAAEWAIVAVFGVAFVVLTMASSVHLRRYRVVALAGTST